jgi:Cu+-exporting ATPase
VFVPAVVGLALVAGIFWGIHSGAERAFVIAAAVLIVACPCAMGLATPAAIMAAANAVARRGILIRDGIALEKAGNISAIVFDKTGTLTLGRPELADIWEAPGREAEIKPLAAALTHDSTHPISRTIAKLADGTRPISNWKEIRGCGVEAHRAPTRQPSIVLRLGSLPWLRECGVDLAAGEPFIAKWSAQGATVVGLAEAGTLLALFAVRDAVKPHAAAVLARLKQHGWDLFLVTGDHAPAAAHVAQQTGIAPENVLAEARPEQKAEFVKKLQARGARVAFVGDGINDAPALAQANLGIAVSRASDIAREAADIILLKSEIEAVPEALGLARATLRTIRQNLFWAFFYNAVGVPLAALGFLSPVFCAAAMGVSDLIVIGNALRLLRWRR